MDFFDGYILVAFFLTIGYIVLIFVMTFGLHQSLKQQIKPIQNHSTRVSVIIPTRNETLNIHSCLNDLLQQDYPRNFFEVIVTDDFSEDQTCEVVQSFIKQHPEFPVSVIDPKGLFPPETGKKKALTRAIDAATGELIITTDADTTHEKSWISSIAIFFIAYKPQMILGPVVFRGEKNMLQKIQSLEFIGLMAITAGSVWLKLPLMCNGANLTFRKEAFQKTGGYEDNYQFSSGDDMFLLLKFMRAYGKKAIMFLGNPQAITYTQAEKTLGGFLNQRIRWISKSRGYSDPWLIFISIYTWMVNFTLLAGMVIGFIDPHFLGVSLVLWFAKILTEYLLVLRMSRFCNKTYLLNYYFLAQLFQWVYVTILGIVGNFLPYRWKGRAIKR